MSKPASSFTEKLSGPHGLQPTLPARGGIQQRPAYRVVIDAFEEPEESGPVLVDVNVLIVLVS